MNHHNLRDITSPSASHIFVAAYPGPIYCVFQEERISSEEQLRLHAALITSSSTASLEYVAAHPRLIYYGFQKERFASEKHLNLSAASNAPVFLTQDSGCGFVSDSANILLEGINEHVRKRKLKHPIISDGCSGKCKRQCHKFSIEERRDLWNQYWNMPMKSRHLFLHKHILITSIKRRTCNQGGTFTKNETRTFFLPKSGEILPVCKSFFLKTLGYRTDGVVTELSKSIKRKQVISSEDGVQIKKAKKPTLNRDLIERHILSYNPVVSHYRHHNSPLTRYLPRSLTVTAMYKDFVLKNPTFKCSVEIYRQKLKDMKISVLPPKSDKCMNCLLFEEESKKYQSPDSFPEEIKYQHEEHKTKAETATNHYYLDSLRINTKITKYYSVDLQNIILLPDMPQVQEAFFLSRLVCFNLTFSPINKSNPLSYCMLWHEALAGRNANNIVDAFVSLIETERDVTNFNFWADNLMAQSKNWTLYTALLILVNSCKWQAETITIKYLMKGHTHMSADSVHENIESRMRREKAIYDFNDFKMLVESSRKNLRVVEVTDFREWPKNEQSNLKSDLIQNFFLSKVVEVKFVRGCRYLLYKENFESEFSELDFLIHNFNFNAIPATIATPRGVKLEKKQNIIYTLAPLMPDDRKYFWLNLPVNEKSSDLAFEEPMSSVV